MAIVACAPSQPPALVLRINYGQDWIQGVYEDGHRVSIGVVDGEGKIKAVAEVVTDTQDSLDGKTGLQTTDEDWFPNPPDLQPYDWIYARVDNGVIAQVQIGEISGAIDVASDSMRGAITAPWIKDPVRVECLDRTSGAEGLKNREGGLVLTTGEDPYLCSWEGAWDIQLGQAIGVGYFAPDDHWVSNVFLSDGTMVVTGTVDVLADDGVCTLREAILASNTNTPSGALKGECPAGADSRTDIIVLAAGEMYSLEIDRRGNDTEADGDLDIRNNSSTMDLVITAAGDGKATISQDAPIVDDRVLENHRATVQIENLIITGGSNVGGGGGILNAGRLAMYTSEVSGNLATWDGGGIHNTRAGILMIESSTIAGNTSTAFAGGIMNKGTLTIRNSEIAGNKDVYGGGGINNERTLIMDNSVLSANVSGQGGALYNAGKAILTNGTVVGGLEDGKGNRATDGGGGLFNVGTLRLQSSTVSGNRAPYGGGLFNWIYGTLIISASTVSGNSANQGGGLHNKENTSVVIQSSVFSDNHAQWSGGGIDNWGTITITGSALHANMSPGEAGDALISGDSRESVTTITGSCIVGNGDTAVFTGSTLSLKASGNWWGDPSGPGGVGPGFGDSISRHVIFSDWLTAAPSICASD